MSTTGYDRPAVIVDEHYVFIRASSIGDCLTKLWLVAQETEPTDEIPPKNRAAMEMGRLLEPVAKAELVRQYEQFVLKESYNPNDRHVFETGLSTSDGHRIVITGTLDGIVHDLSDGENYVLEIKTRNESWFSDVEKNGNWLSQREAVMQGALYYRMVLGWASGGLIIASMNRGDGKVHTEKFDFDHISDAMGEVGKFLQDMLERADPTNFTHPGLDRSFNHQECQSCQFRSLCNNVIDENYEDRQMPPVNVEQVRDALINWEPYKLEEKSVPQKVREGLNEIILAHMKHHEPGEKIILDGEEAVWTIAKRQRTNTSIDTERLREILTLEQWEEVNVVKAGEPYPEIRKAPKRR